MKKRPAAAARTTPAAATPSPYAQTPPVREVRAACPACGSSRAEIIKSETRQIGCVTRVDRWRRCACGQRFRSYVLEQRTAANPPPSGGMTHAGA